MGSSRGRCRKNSFHSFGQNGRGRSGSGHAISVYIAKDLVEANLVALVAFSNDLPDEHKDVATTIVLASENGIPQLIFTR